MRLFRRLIVSISAAVAAVIGGCAAQATHFGTDCIKVNLVGVDVARQEGLAIVHHVEVKVLRNDCAQVELFRFTAFNDSNGNDYPDESEVQFGIESRGPSRCIVLDNLILRIPSDPDVDPKIAYEIWRVGDDKPIVHGGPLREGSTNH